MAKNIVVFSDGTGQEGGKGNNTNVYKLFNMVEDRTSRQVAFYDRGLGTGWRRITGNGAGMGISKNIKECYRFIFDNYEAGDRIFLFGFSRGATTVRSLSSFIDLFGILPKSRSELIDEAWNIYRIKYSREEKKLEKRHRTRIIKADAFVKQHHTMWCKIEFLGVWDSVAALGVPFETLDYIVEKVLRLKHKFHDIGLSESVKNAYHALAIDDERKTFYPEIWPNEIKSWQNLRQVWFCGMHTDVGGGYGNQQLSDITLNWMVEKASSHGLHIYPKNKVAVNPDPDGFMHDSRGGTFSRFFRKQERFWPFEEETHPPIVHWSVLERKRNKTNELVPQYSPWIFNCEYDVEDENGKIIGKEEWVNR